MPEVSSRPTQVVGNYELVHKIAEGGMGAVYKARHRETGDIVAIKIIPPATAKNPTLLKRFEAEFNAAYQIDHPNVVKAIEYNGSSATPFLVMEFVDGESIGNLIEREGPIPEDLAIRIIAQVCQGLHRAHKQKMIHRDVKPDNIMLTQDGVAKLTDLGLVKEVDGDNNLTRTGRGLGTPHFMAPEQFRNAKNADVRCDIYSLGATLYMMITGEVPFGKVGPLDCWMKKIRNDFTPPRDLKPDITDRVDWAIRRAMSGDPEQRPATCREFVEDLTGITIRPKAPTPSNPNAPTVEAVAVSSNANWYLVYKDETGETHTVKGTTDGIRKALKEGLLGDAGNIRACQNKQGPFKYMKDHPEFRDLVVSPAPFETQKPSTTPVAAARPAAPERGLGDTDPESVSMRRPAPVEDSPLRPHIPMQPARNFDWAFWGIIGGVVIGTILLAVMFLSKAKL